VRSWSQAELRSNVFAILKPDQQQQSSAQGDNVALGRLKSTREGLPLVLVPVLTLIGRLVLDMIAEFLDFCQLSSSASVFNAEVSLVRRICACADLQPEHFDQSLRPIIVQELHLPPVAAQPPVAQQEPLLLTLLKHHDILVRQQHRPPQHSSGAPARPAIQPPGMQADGPGMHRFCI
jgi:hypothetical protein